MSTPIEQIEAFIKAHQGPWIMSRVGSFGFDVSMTLWWKHDHQVVLSLRSKADLQDLDVGVYFGAAHTNCIHDLDFGAPLLTRSARRVVDVMQLYGVGVGDLPLWLQDPVRVQLRQRAATLLALADGAPPCS